MYTPVGATVDAGLPRQLELPPAACTARRPISNLTTPDDPLSNTPRTGPWDWHKSLGGLGSTGKSELCAVHIIVLMSIPPSGVARESSGPGGPLSYLLPVDDAGARATEACSSMSAHSSISSTRGLSCSPAATASTTNSPPSSSVDHAASSLRSAAAQIW